MLHFTSPTKSIGSRIRIHNNDEKDHDGWYFLLPSLLVCLCGNGFKPANLKSTGSNKLKKGRRPTTISKAFMFCHARHRSQSCNNTVYRYQCCGSVTIFFGSGSGSHFSPSFGSGSEKIVTDPDPTSKKFRIQFRIRP
jgi:hypothetical protein